MADAFTRRSDMKLPGLLDAGRKEQRVDALECLSADMGRPWSVAPAAMSAVNLAKAHLPPKETVQKSRPELGRPCGEL